MISLAASRSTWPAHQGYFAQTGVHALQAGADGATAGRWWLLCPTGSAVRIYIVKVSFVCQHNSVLATPTGPRITLEKMSHSGAGASSVTAVSALSGAPTPTAIVRTTAPTTPVAFAAFHAFMPSGALTAVGAAPMSSAEFEPVEPLEVVAGQGIVCRQPDVGTTSETSRRFATSVYWIEV